MWQLSFIIYLQGYFLSSEDDLIKSSTDLGIIARHTESHKLARCRLLSDRFPIEDITVETPSILGSKVVSTPTVSFKDC